MGYLLILISTVLLYAAAGSFVSLAQSRTGTFFIAGGVGFALGAYCAAILMTNGVTDVLILITASVLVSSAAGSIIALSTAAHDRRVLDVVGLALLLLCATVVRSWYTPGADPGSLGSLTNGGFGLGDFRPLTILGYSVAGGGVGALLISSVLFLLATWVVHIAGRSTWGLSLLAIRDDRLQGALDGYRILTRQVSLGVLIAGGLGAAGAGYALNYGFIDPSIWSIETAIGICLVPLIFPWGGSVLRATAGAVLFVLIPELLRGLNVAASYESYLRNLIFLALAILANMGSARSHWQRRIAAWSR